MSLLQQEFPLLDQETLVETVSYDETGEAILGGRASNLDSIVRIYLDNQFIKDADVRAVMIWSTSLQEILPGQYALRIDEISSLGQVVGRVEMPFQKEDKDFIAAMLESVSQAANAPPGVDTDVQLPQLVTVQRGYTLWGISRSRYGLGRLYVNIFNLNQDQIRDPDLIYPGQIFRMPGEDNLFDPEYGRQFIPAQ
ncbi:MAG: LysM peptidoglycan-binding domain-containing protein [Rhodobacteraceae bacterium]|nr:LysM peptidoglycan-binding domain-containing protein [Paracoccaceae bacterium]